MHAYGVLQKDANVCSRVCSSFPIIYPADCTQGIWKDIKTRYPFYDHLITTIQPSSKYTYIFFNRFYRSRAMYRYMLYIFHMRTGKGTAKSKNAYLFYSLLLPLFLTGQTVVGKNTFNKSTLPELTTRIHRNWTKLSPSPEKHINKTGFFCCRYQM